MPRRRADRVRGQSLVEFVLVLPVIMLILGGLIQFASIFERQIGLENAAREVGRSVATLPTDDSNARNYATWAVWCLKGQLGDVADNCDRHLLSTYIQGYDPADVRVARVCFDNGPADPAGQPQIVVTVDLEYAHPLFVPFVAMVLDGLDADPGHLLAATTIDFRVENGDVIAPLSAQVCV